MTYNEHYPSTLQELEPFLGFMYDSLDEIADERRANLKLSREELLKVLFHCIKLNIQYGTKHIIVLEAGGALIGYGVYFENTSFWADKRVGLIHTVYVKGNHPRACAIMLERCIENAKLDGVEVLETWARRFNEGAFRYYERRFGFEMNAYVFKKELK